MKSLPARWRSHITVLVGSIVRPEPGPDGCRRVAPVRGCTLCFGIAAGTSISPLAAERLKPYVPRLVVEWLRDTPDARHRQVEGSLAFVDISGFTELTERLARRGKVGAEEVSDTLQTLFTELLDVAYDYGAGLLKWGGDALLLLYDGNDHASRCCRAAVGMQETLERIGRLRMAGGTVTLRMSVGVHSGAFDAFLVGSSHRELLVTGPAATATVEMESEAEAGQILISAATAELVGSACLGRAAGGGFLLSRAPDTAVAPAPDVGDVSAIDLPSCIPLELRRQLLVEQGEAEHRTVSVGFVQFSGTDALLREEGAAALSAGLEALVANIQDACERFDVTFFASDIDRDGGKIILVTGAPWSGGDDEERLLRAVRMILDRPGTIRVRVGVNSGRAFTCDFGPPYRRTYQVYGDAVNLAARVMGKAAPGQALATEATLARARSAYETEELPPFLVKGKSEPVRAVVLGAVAGTKVAAGATTHLVGREPEMAQLLGATKSTRSGCGGVVELIGEPGIGKSRLVEELEMRSEIHSFRAACEQYEASTPYFALRGLLHDLLHCPRDAEASAVERALRGRVGSAAPDLAPWIPLLGTALGIELAATPETERLDERFLPERTAIALVRLLSALRPEPTLFVFDDAHWMDEASAGVLARISDQIAERPWLALVTRREETSGFVATPAPHVSTIPLSPLAAHAATELAIATTEDAPLPPHVLDALVERSGGNPLLLQELIAAMLAGAGLDELPDSVEALMAAHIDRLDPGERTALRYASVLGTSFEIDLLAEALGEDASVLTDGLWRRLDEFLGEDEPGVLRFRHALARDAAYEGLPFRRRRALHERVARTIERRAGAATEDEAEHLSLHYFHARELAKAWHYSRVAGERAAAIYANVEASRFFARALEVAPRLRPVPRGDVARLWEGLGDVRLRLNEFEAAGAAFRSARRRTHGDPVEEARLMSREAVTRWRMGRHSQALRWLTRALKAIEHMDGDPAAAQRARLYVWCATVRQEQRRPTDAIAWCRRAIDVADRVGARDALAHAYYILDWAYQLLGRPEEAVYGSRAVAIYEELGDLDRLASALNNLGGRAYLDGRWDAALELAERARRACEMIGDQGRASITAYNVAEVMIDQGRLDEAEPMLQDVLRIWRTGGSRINVAEAASLLGRLMARSGRFEEARALLGEARAICLEEGDRVELLSADVRLAECAVLAGEGPTALPAIDGLLAQVQAMEGVSMLAAGIYRLRGWALMRDGHLDEAEDALRESLRTARDGGADFGIKSAQYEAALTLGALVRLGRARGADVGELETERDTVLGGLGVVRIPEPPLGLAPMPD